MRRRKAIRILGIIPARGGSKGIPYKNITPLLGKPLIYYTIRAAQNAKLLDAFIVSTDDVKIAAVAGRFGADVPFLRQKKFAGDKSSEIGFLKHSLVWLEKHRGWRPEIVVKLYPTAPLRTADDIDRVIRFILKTGCDSVRTITTPANNPFKMWYLDNASRKITPLLPTRYFTALGTDVNRQMLPEVYWQDGFVNATRTKFIKAGKLYGPDIRGIYTDPKRVVDIDGPEDVKAAAKILRAGKNKKK